MAPTGPVKVKKASHEEIKKFISTATRAQQAGEWTTVGTWEVGKGRKSGNSALANQQYHIELTKDGQLIYYDKTRNFEQIKKPKKLDSLLDDTTRQSISVWNDLVLLRDNALSIDMAVKVRANGQLSRLNTKLKHDGVVTEFKELRQRLEKANLLPVDIAILDRLASQSWQPPQQKTRKVVLNDYRSGNPTSHKESDASPTAPDTSAKKNSPRNG